MIPHATNYIVLIAFDMNYIVLIPFDMDDIVFNKTCDGLNRIISIWTKLRAGIILVHDKMTRAGTTLRVGILLGIDEWTSR